MELMNLLDPLALAAISPLALMITQYIKDKIPDKTVPYANIAAGLLAAFLYYYKPGVVPDFNQVVMMVINGAIGAGGSDLVYDFLRAKPGSPQFSLSSKPVELPKPPKTLKELDPKIQAAIDEAIKEMATTLLRPPAGVVKP
jgi:hypothetical protein